MSAQTGAPFPAVTIDVYGQPMPAGSKSIVMTAAGPRAVEGKSATQRAARGQWRHDVINATRAVIGEDAEPLEGPLALDLILYVPRPKTKRPARHPYPIARPDTTKLLRATEDALTHAGVWRDDSQVVEMVISKRYADDRPPGARIHIYQL